MIADGRVRVGQGAAQHPAMTLTTNLGTLIGLVSGAISPNNALRSRDVSVEGQSDELRRFVDLFAWGARLREQGGSARFGH